MIKNVLFSTLVDLPRKTKQFIVLVCDFTLGLFCVVLAFYLRLDLFLPLKGPVLITALISSTLYMPIFWMLGLYNTIFRYPGINIVLSIFTAVLVYSLLFIGIVGLFGIPGIPRSIGIIQPILLFIVVLLSRVTIKKIYIYEKKKTKILKSILIYGAGNAGQQLASSLENNFEFNLVGFLDDNKKITGNTINGYKIYSPDRLKFLIKEKEIQTILIAIPSINRFKKNEIIKKLSKHKVVIQTLPSISEIVKGNITIADIKELDVEDLIDREIVEPKKELLIKNIKSKIVLVTGAGGSIGAELCRQIIKNSPLKLILLEISEASLHKVNEELQILNRNIEIIPILGNAKDEIKMMKLFEIFKINTVYHAAAYKHVPLVENNICEGVLNNVFSTLSLLKASINNSVSNFVLVSSDKAVRPTNIMGVTKRISELCVQAIYHNQKKPKTKMSMVRFGNVLESSGSVIPKFKEQIKNGGPITLTHSEVTRYFMTVTEAAQLVIQAGAMSESCDVFILDMGKSIKIIDLIKRIVKLSGLTIKNSKNPNGDIEIKIIGLRPGEKLYEELLLGNNPSATSHEKIYKASDLYIPLEELSQKLNILKSLISNNDVQATKTLLSEIVSFYNSTYKITDHYHIEKMKSK